MSLSILDTDSLSLFRQGQEGIVRRMSQSTPGELVITVITVEEQLSGWYTLLRRAKSDSDLARTYQRLADTIKVLASFPILPYTEAAIARYEQLRTMKLNVGGMDLRIAAIALEQGGTVITRNLADFQRIPGLSCEDWAA
jgi:tRNA(fMet)-specific endonuclease VapC